MDSKHSKYLLRTPLYRQWHYFSRSLWFVAAILLTAGSLVVWSFLKERYSASHLSLTHQMVLGSASKSDSAQSQDLHNQPTHALKVPYGLKANPHQSHNRKALPTSQSYVGQRGGAFASAKGFNPKPWANSTSTDSLLSD